MSATGASFNVEMGVTDSKVYCHHLSTADPYGRSVVFFSRDFDSAISP